MQKAAYAKYMISTVMLNSSKLEEEIVSAVYVEIKNCIHCSLYQQKSKLMTILFLEYIFASLIV